MTFRTQGFILSVYFLLSCCLLHEGFAQGKIIGGNSTDLWNTLWNVDFFWQSLFSFEIPVRTERLNTPFGGNIWVSDFLGAITMGPFVFLGGWDWGYQFWIVSSCALLGWMTHLFALDLGAKNGAWVSGISVLFSGVFISSLHNGASEGIGLFWLVLGIWKVWSFLQRRSLYYWGFACAVLAGLSSWYSAVLMAVFWFGLCVFFNRERPWKLFFLWIGTMIPLAYYSLMLTTGSSNLIGIKTPENMDQVRRTIGSSSLLDYFVPVSIDSFSDMWKFGGDYIHSSYIGSVLFFLFCWAMIENKKNLFTVPILLSFVLSLGPVLVYQNHPVLIWDNRGVPLPYFLLEYMWGFQSLSLLYKFSFGVVLGMALLVGKFVGSRSTRFVTVIIIAMIAEFGIVSPVRNFPSSSQIPSSNGLEILSKKESGSVLNHPVVSGAPYLFEQIIHKKPIYDSINKPTNSTGRDIWSRISESGCSSVSGEKTVYLVSHLQIEHRPQREDRLVQKAIKECSVLYSDKERIIVEVQ